jgi:hypothetical protein
MTIDIPQIVQLQRQTTADWHDVTPAVTHTGFLQLMLQNHLHNFTLWHEEDKARRDDKGYEYVYHAKRNIDHHNQQRNNMMEAMDQWLHQELQPAQTGCRFNSETPGMIIDRLSILALKQYHMHIQTTREHTSPEHIQNCQAKLTIIERQLSNLQRCLTELIEDISAKHRSFYIYRQCKMYNDPNLNPQLYNNPESITD